MFRARKPQRDLFSARNQYRDLLRPGSFYELLAEHGESIFSDHKFVGMYCDDNGRPCIPPSQMFILLLLSIHDGCSDYEAIERSRCDVRWLAALDLKLGDKLCGRSTLVEFRARVLLNEEHEKQFKANLELARRLGVLKGSHLEVALDTTPMLGRGALKDTYNLVADGIRKLAGTLATADALTAEVWAKSHDLSRYWEGSSLKGDAEIDWSDAGERRVFLNSLVADAGRLLHLAETRAASSPEHAGKIKGAAELLNRLITQDTEPEPGPNDPKKAKKQPASKGNADTAPVASKEPTDPPHDNPGPAPAAGGGDATPAVSKEPTDPTHNSPEPAPAAGSGDFAPGPDCEQPTRSTGIDESTPGGCSDAPTPAAPHLLGEMVRIRDGVAEDRTISAHDTEMRHGRKSASKRFDGHKTSVCVNPASKLILSLDVIAGNAADNTGALNLAQQAAKNTGIPVTKAIGDCAYGDAATRQAFEDAGIDLSAKVPSPPANEPFHRSRFVLDLTNKIATCPANQTTSETNYAYHRSGTTEQFQFPLSTCQSCPDKEECLLAADKKRGRGRTLTLHPQEHLLERARQHQKSPAFRQDIKARQVVEHRQARMIQLGGRQARYFGRAKSKYQSYMIAIVANLTQMVGAISLSQALALVVGPLSHVWGPSRPYALGVSSLQGGAKMRPAMSQAPGLRLAS